MFKLLKRSILFYLLFLTWSSLAYSRDLFYQVEKGDYLGLILVSLGYPVAEGNKDWLIEFYEHNKELLKSNPHFIRPGQSLLLPMSEIDFSCNVEVKDSGQVLI